MKPGESRTVSSLIFEWLSENSVIYPKFILLQFFIHLQCINIKKIIYYSVADT